MVPGWRTGSGSDLASLKLKAVEDGENFIVNEESLDFLRK